MSTSTIVLEFDQCVSRLGKQRHDRVSYGLFLTIMKDMKMVSQAQQQSLSRNLLYLLEQAWKLVKEPEGDYAVASSILDFLLILARNSCPRLRPDHNDQDNRECDLMLMAKFKGFVDSRNNRFSISKNRKSQVVVNQQSNKDQHTRSIDFAPANHQHSRQVSILSQKTIVQIQVNLGSRVQTIRLSRDDDVEEVARKFIAENGLTPQAEAQLVRLILASLNELN